MVDMQERQVALPADIQKAITSAFEDLREKVWSNEDKLAKSAPNDNQPKAWFADPFALLDSVGMGYRNPPVYLTYDTLRQVAERDTYVAPIIFTRQNQVAAFAKPQRNKYSVGFVIQPRYGDKKRELTRGEQDRVRFLTAFMLNCGRDYNVGRDDLDTFVRKFVRDSLTYDQACLEKVRTRGGSPFSFHMVPSDTIRTATPKQLRGTPPRVDEIKKDIRFVQVINSSITAEFTLDEMAFVVRNPRTHVKTYGYGFPEIEVLIATITSHLWAEEWNRKAFSQGSTVKGLLNVKGNIQPQQFEAFKRTWNSQVAGVSNAWKTPMLNSEDVQWIPMQLSNTEMGYQMWTEYLCFVPGTRVMTPGGEVMIEDVEPGDIVFSHTGEQRHVVNIQEHHHRGMVINIAVGGETIQSTPEHPFLVAERVEGLRVGAKVIRAFASPAWVNACDLDPGRHYMLVPKETYAPRHDVNGTQAAKLAEWLAGDKGDHHDTIKTRLHEDDVYFYVPIRETWTSDYDGPVHNMEVDVDNTYQVNRFATHNCKVTTAMYLIDPAEINFDLRGGVGQQPVFMSTNEAQQKASKDRGLSPLLGTVSSALNRHVVWQIDPEFEFAFVGIDAKTEEQAMQLRQQQAQTHLKLNEVRALDGLPPVEYGDVVLNPVYIGYRTQMLMMAQQQQVAQQQAQAPQPGQPGQGGPPPRFTQPPGAEESHGAEQVRQFAEGPGPNGGSGPKTDDESSGPSPKTMSRLHVDDWDSVVNHSLRSDDLAKGEVYDAIDLD